MLTDDGDRPSTSLSNADLPLEPDEIRRPTMSFTTLDALGVLLKIALVLVPGLTAVAYQILVERKIAAFAQDRLGPNRAGRDLRPPRQLGFLKPVFDLVNWLAIYGVWHALADGAKMILKEDVVPGHVNKPLFVLAPILAIITAVLAFAVVPFGPVGVGSSPENFQFQIAPGVDIGILYIFAIGSLNVYAVILAGWASNNKYSFLGGLRSSAQLISYEIPLGLSILGVVLVAGSLDLGKIVAFQANTNLLFFLPDVFFLPAWGIFIQPLAFLIFLVSAFAETNRLPFDLPESEQELVGGFHTEYSAMKFGMFFLAEYLHIITVSFLVVILFLGGWDAPFLNVDQSGWIASLAKVAVLVAKVTMVILFMMWIRWTLPRFRYDTLMDVAWKNMIPLSLANLLFTAFVVQVLRS